MQPLYLILATIIFFTVLSVDLITDLGRWKRNIPVDHTKGFVLRLLALTPIAFILNYTIIPFLGFLYWFLFDGIYNVARGFNWWFTGSDDIDDSGFDNIIQKMTLKEHIAIKVGGILVSFFVFLWLNKIL